MCVCVYKNEYRNEKDERYMCHVRNKCLCARARVRGLNRRKEYMQSWQNGLARSDRLNKAQKNIGLGYINLSPFF